MALNLKTRLEKLEAVVPASAMNFCVVVHHPGEDCEQTRAAAIAAYIQQNGHAPHPDRFMHMHFISPDTKRPICGCADKEVLQ